MPGTEHATGGEIFPAPILSLAATLVAALRARRSKITVAESCTGGMLGAAITSIAGASDVFDLGFITYSNAAKTEMIGVPNSLLALHGAVSAQVAAAMATGAQLRASSSLAVSVTGVAGPGGGTLTKPVGLVFLGLASVGAEPETQELRLGNIGRTSVRLKTTEAALALALSACCERI